MNYEEIKKLIDDMGNSKLDKLDIEFPDGIKISMKKDSNAGKQVEIEQNSFEKQEINKKISLNETENKQELENNYNIIKSPMVGTFYSSSSPKEKAFVKVGDKVQKGQVVCIIEAMKLMNEIESEYDGEIVEICVKNEDVVEFGMPLFKIANRDGVY